MKSSRILTASILLALVHHANAASFTISTASTTPQTLGTGSGQTGSITATGSLTVSGGTDAVTLSGNNATLTNLGTLRQIGTGRGMRDSSGGVTGLIVTNGSTTNSTALMQTADADVIQLRGTGTSVTLSNYGSMISFNASAGGAQAVDFAGILTGANTINNYATGLMQANAADAVRPGVNGIVFNAGTIKSIEAVSTTTADAIDVQTNTGVQITNDPTGLVEGARHGITGGASNSLVTFTTSITNNAGGIIKGNNGSGINLDGFNGNQTATIINHGTINGNGVAADGDGIDVDGIINLTNTGIIRSLNAVATNSEGVTVGGGTITNSGTIEGLIQSGTGLGIGVSIVGNTITPGVREPIYGNTTITNQSGGLIRGDSAHGILVGAGTSTPSGFAVTINNHAGATIRGGGATYAAIQTGADSVTLSNAGTITADSSNNAITFGSANDTLNITGGAAAINGNINGGGGTNMMTVNPGTGNSFSYGGVISNFSSVSVQSGTVAFTGANTYTGSTTISGGTLQAGAAGALGGTSGITVNTGGTLLLSNLGTTDRINNAATITMSGGTIAFSGNVTEGSSPGTGALTLTASSVIDFGGGNDLINFGASNGATWTGGAILSIWNWGGSYSGGGNDQLKFGFDATALTAGQLAQISFYSGAGTGFLGTGGFVGSSGEVVPVPEPGPLATALGMVGLIYGRERRRFSALRGRDRARC